MSRPQRARRAILVAALAAATALAGCAAGLSPAAPAAPSDAPAPAPVTVFAAASLTAAFTEIAALDPALAVTLSFDGSPTLVDQVAAGAPADVLATADVTTMTRARDAGLLAGEPVTFAANTAVLIVPRGNPGAVTGLDVSLEGRRLVVCAPTVPCGATAHAIADAAGVTLRPVSEEQKVTDVRGKVASGEADAGIVFATDALAAGDAVETLPLPGAAQAATTYPIAVVHDAPHPDAAAAFVALITGPDGRDVLAAHGFTLP
ncbi:molybdate ABC transporter substrate-binding protein [Propioniciclava soli]|uniref:Molybdate ABC transporter substrate-binding protein n=1 Tax=Propioniciclava soli TaxID=2775081 RepID=A0ABZ3C9A7_9ACTN